MLINYYLPLNINIFDYFLQDDLIHGKIIRKRKTENQRLIYTSKDLKNNVILTQREFNKIAEDFKYYFYDDLKRGYKKLWGFMNVFDDARKRYIEKYFNGDIEDRRDLVFVISFNDRNYDGGVLLENFVTQNTNHFYHVNKNLGTENLLLIKEMKDLIYRGYDGMGRLILFSLSYPNISYWNKLTENFGNKCINNNPIFYDDLNGYIFDFLIWHYPHDDINCQTLVLYGYGVDRPNFKSVEEIDYSPNIFLSVGFRVEIINWFYNHQNNNDMFFGKTTKQIKMLREYIYI